MFPEQIAEPFGKFPALSFTKNKRFWTSTSVVYPKWPISIYDKGGGDAMLATGEPNSDSFTWGSQRPALQYS